MALRYVVTRQNWKQLATGFARLPGAVDVAAFDAPEAAAADRDRREAAARGAFNPFAWGDSLFDVTRLAPYALCDWLQEAGLTTPPADAPRDEWAAWWERAQPEMAADQFARAWEAFDKHRLFDSEERDRQPAVYALTMVPWEREDEYTDHRTAAFEGGMPHAVFRTADAAAAEGESVAAGRIEQAFERYDPEYYNEYAVGARARFAADPLGPSVPDDVRRGSDPAGIPRFEVTPVELVGGAGKWPRTRRVSVVIRLGWFSARFEQRAVFRHWSPVSPGQVCGVPVRAFENCAAAEACAWDLDIDARRWLNPFRFGHPRDLTTLREGPYRAMLADLGLDMPSGGWDQFDSTQQPVWAAWYEHAACLLTDDQRETVWDLLDQLRFHQVVDLELRE